MSDMRLGDTRHPSWQKFWTDVRIEGMQKALDKRREEPSVINQKPTMTLNLSEKEMAVLDQLSKDLDLSKTAVMRQALRLFQLVDIKVKLGESVTINSIDGGIVVLTNHSES